MAAPPLTLYVHFPWCVAKCPYCDFNSHALQDELPAERYLAALLEDLRGWPAEYRRRPLQSVFLGGGTPSLFPAALLERLLNGIADACALADEVEITLEANPGTVEHDAFAGYRAAGINRLSLGVQSFADAQLRALGRIHSSADAVRAFEAARAAGLDNINVDLMYALPDQTLAGAEADIYRAIELQPEHVSHYHLTLEPNTVFYARPPVLPAADVAWDMQTACADRLAAAGYEHYEVSAWARPGRSCGHNRNYWSYGDYLAIGAGAHAKVTAADGTVLRAVRAAHPRAFERQLATDGGARLLPVPPAERPFEFMLNALRLRQGASVVDYRARTGLDLQALEPGLAAAVAAGLLEPVDSGVLRATARGWRFLDDLQALFLPAVADQARGSARGP